MLKWVQIEEIIKKCKFPLIYYISIIVNHKYFKINDLNLVLQFFLKYHINIFLKYPLYKLNVIFKLPNNVVMNFYNIYIRKVDLIHTMILFKNKIKKFKNKSIKYFLDYFSNNLIIFKAIFDSNNTQLGFHIKMIEYFKYNKIIFFINNEIESRLKSAIKLFSIDFYNFFEIKILSYYDYYNLNGMEKFYFINNFYITTLKIIEFINQKKKTNDIFDYHLDVLLNPRFIKINSNTNIHSETENDDINYFNIK